MIPQNGGETCGTRREYIPVGSSPASLRAPGASGNFPHPCGSSMPTMVGVTQPNTACELWWKILGKDIQI